MSSANRLANTKVQKITRLANPSRCALIRRQALAAGLCLGALVELVEFATRVHPDVAQVADELGDESDQREEKERSHHHRVIAPDDAVVAEKAEAVEREQRFDQQGTREKS